MLAASQTLRCPKCGAAPPEEALFCPVDGTPLLAEEEARQERDRVAASPAADIVGEVLDGRYLVEERLGAGGMGVVYRATHTSLGRQFAVKVLKRDFGGDPEAMERFVREARATSGIGHPNIVNVVDFGTLGDGSPYFVMEFLQGETLSARIAREGALPMAHAYAIAEQIGEALQAAHALGIVHRDLKPDNVFLVPMADGPRVKLLDFGVAKVLGAARKLTRTGIVFGTPQYMSPEQAAGQAVDHRTDVYALGLLLYEMVTGQVPFQGDTFMGVLSQHMFDPPRPPSEVLGRDVGPVERVILKALQKNPEARHPDMVAFLDELRRAREGVLEADEEEDGGATRALSVGRGNEPAVGTRALGPVQPSRGSRPSAPGPSSNTEATLAAIPGLRRRGGPSWLLAAGVAALVFVVGGVALLLLRTRQERGAHIEADTVAVRAGAQGAEGTAHDRDEAGGDEDVPQGAEPPAPALSAARRNGKRPAARSLKRVELRSVPPGAEVVEDGVTVGNTPLTVSLSPGVRRVLRLQAPGYLPKEVTLSDRSVARLEVRLQRRPGTPAGGASRLSPPRSIRRRPPRRPPASGSPEPAEIVDPWEQP